MITDSSTANYDSTYLTGTQGSYDFVALADELNAYTNGLSCIAAVSDQIGSGISARDGVAASLYYLELYLKRARTAHPTVYAALQASPEWIRFVRYAWARGMLWRHVGHLRRARHRRRRHLGARRGSGERRRDRDVRRRHALPTSSATRAVVVARRSCNRRPIIHASCACSSSRTTRTSPS